MKNKFLLMALLCACVVQASAQINTDSLLQIYNEADTTEYGEENPFMKGETLKNRNPQNKAQERGDFYGLDYVMERRFLEHGEQFTRRWHDHLFFSIGAGAEQLVAPTHEYGFQPLTTVHLGIGKQFNKYHSLRLIGEGAFGYQQHSNHVFMKYGAKLDYLFSLSSYFNGYNPSRLLDASAVLGGGYQHSKMGKGGVDANYSDNSYEGHLGLQLRFFTGPQGYLNAEPYVGIGSDQMDLSRNRNWRMFDLFYGVRLSFIYYLHNNLSPESRMRFIKKRNERNTLSPDSVLRSWQQPWFLEFSNGLSFIKTPQTSFSESMGNEMTISVGKWFSPVIGLRLSMATRMSTWDVNKTPKQETPTYRPPYERKVSNVYASGRMEAMLNPLGFNRNYSWNAPLGFYLLAGAEMGWLVKYEADRLSCRSEAYTAGLHLWARLTDGLQVFMEPRYARNIYKVPYTNKKWEKLYRDDSYTINVGLTVNTIGRRFRRVADDAEGWNGRLSFGLGGGTNFIQTKGSYGNARMGYNAGAFVQYRVSHVSSVRLSYEYVSLSKKCLSAFFDYPSADVNSNAGRVSRTGLLELNYSLGMASLDYVISLTDAMNGYRPGRRFNFSLALGPTWMNRMERKATLDGSERLQDGHVVKIPEGKAPRSCVGGNGALMLTYNISKHLGVFFAPQVYIMPKELMPEYEMLKQKFVETINLGVQYRL